MDFSKIEELGLEQLKIRITWDKEERWNPNWQINVTGKYVDLETQRFHLIKDVGFGTSIEECIEDVLIDLEFSIDLYRDKFKKEAE